MKVKPVYLWLLIAALGVTTVILFYRIQQLDSLLSIVGGLGLSCPTPRINYL
jgi:hypothetical protein